MLWEFIFYTVISFLSVYGLVELIIYILDFVYDIKTLKDKIIYTVVAVKNEEERIENIVRTLLVKTLKNGSGVADHRLLVVDMGSEDATYEMLKLMEEDKNGLISVRYDELLKELEKGI